MMALATQIAEQLQFHEPNQFYKSPQSQGDRLPVVGVLTQPVVASVLVEIAVLELHPLPLHQQIQAFAEQAIALEYQSVKILPLFLLAGVHVTEDIPAEVAIAQHQLGSRIVIEQLPHVGSDVSIQGLVVNQAQKLAGATPLLLAHGSRRLEGNAVIEAIAQRIGGVAAYWSVPPSLETQVAALIQRGCSDITILPYFLFAGGITDAIAQTVDHLAIQFPYVDIRLAQPLAEHPHFVDAILKLLDDHRNRQG